MIAFRPRVSLLLFATACAASAALAHKPSDSYLRLQNQEGQLAVEWDIAIKDLDFVIGLDANGDSQITWGELKSQRQAIAAHALGRLRLATDGHERTLQLVDLRVSEHSDGAYAVLVVDVAGEGEVGSVAVDYDLLFDVDPTHRGLVLYSDGGIDRTYILSPTSKHVDIEAGETHLFAAFADFVGEGVWHIWIGYDHILFLISLLLPAVMCLRERRWYPVESFGPACWAVLKIVTVFTLAHSITLWLAVMDYVILPGRMIESVIALSIIVTALHNLYPIMPISGWNIAFGFGLVHGFGFANVLTDLGLNSSTLAVALFGFNVGVELGQMAIVLVCFPIAFALRKTQFYRWGILSGGSLLIAVVAGIWFYERVANVTILGF